VLHPILLAVAWVLNQGLSTEAEWAGLVRPVLIAAGGAMALTLLGWAGSRNRWDGGLVASLLILLIILPFPAFKLWQSLGPQAGFLAVAAAMITAIGVPIVLAVRARRLGRPMPRPSAGRLNTFAGIFVLVVLVSNTVWDAGTAIGRLTSPEAVVQAPPTESTPPDIVVVLLDGYPRSDVLARRLGIDNAAFLQALTDRGFDVAADSRSNYVFTALTLASLFQMRHLDEIDEVRPFIGTSAPHHDLLRHTATSGRAFSVLRSAGYEIVTSPPGWEHVTLASASDRTLATGHITDLERSLLEQTWLLDLVTLVSPHAITGQLRDHLVQTLDSLDAFAAEVRDRPAFLFLHVPGPHPPLVVDAEGETVPLDARSLGADDPEAMHMTREEYSAAWEAELAYLNRRVLAGIDRLQAADPSTVIIVMADHGYIQEVSSEDPGARFANLLAAYTPGAPGLLRDPPTLVNLMPRLLNEYLGTDFAISPDRYFLSPGPLEPLMLTEVSDPDAAE
jgi:hypothetical protein